MEPVFSVQYNKQEVTQTEYNLRIIINGVCQEKTIKHRRFYVFVFKNTCLWCKMINVLKKSSQCTDIYNREFKMFNNLFDDKIIKMLVGVNIKRNNKILE